MYNLFWFLQDNLFVSMLTISYNASINLINFAHIKRVVKNMTLTDITKCDTFIGDLTTEENFNQATIDVLGIIVCAVNILFRFLQFALAVFLGVFLLFRTHFCILTFFAAATDLDVACKVKILLKVKILENQIRQASDSIRSTCVSRIGTCGTKLLITILKKHTFYNINAKGLIVRINENRSTMMIER